MIEITKENLNARIHSINLQLFGAGSKMRLFIRDLDYGELLLGNYHIEEVPLKYNQLKQGNISEIFNYQQAIFDTIKMIGRK